MVRKFDIAVPGDRVFTEIHGEGWRQAVIAVIVAVKAVDAGWYDAEDIYVKNTRYIPHYCNLAVQRDGRVRYNLSCSRENPVSMLLPACRGMEVEQLRPSNPEGLHGKCLWEPADKVVL